MWNDKQSFLAQLGEHWRRLSNDSQPPTEPPVDMVCSTIPLQSEKVRWYQEQMVRDMERLIGALDRMKVDAVSLRKELLENIERSYTLENTSKRCIDG